MRNVLVALFWLWVLVSLSVYAVRIWRRINHRSTAGSASAAAPVAPAPVGAPAPAVVPTAAPTTTGSLATTAPVEPEPPRAVERATPAPVPSVPPAAGRSGLFAPRSDLSSAPAEREPDPAAARPIVADALAGIRMPAGLTPVVSNQPFVDPYRVAFTTTTATAAEVGAALGDELERLGFSLASLSDHEVEASREGVRVRATIHTDPAALTVAGAPVIAHPAPGTVAVSFET